MAKVPRKKATEDGSKDAPGIAARSRTARKLLMAALLLSAVSLGGGFFLARMAYMQDTAAHQPDYVDSAPAATGAPADAAIVAGVVDPLAHGSGPTKKAAASTPAGGNSRDGLLDFKDIMTNINGFDVQGRPTRAFLKLTVVLMYRTDPGAKEMLTKRQPFMRDLFNAYARGLTEADVRGTAGILNVKAELLKRARAAAGNDLPEEILISDLIVQ